MIEITLNKMNEIRFYGMQHTFEMLLNTKGIDLLDTNESLHMLFQFE
jgi:hypothetical protein